MAGASHTTAVSAFLPATEAEVEGVEIGEPAMFQLFLFATSSSWRMTWARNCNVSALFGCYRRVFRFFWHQR
jgi:hypothetical protein